MASDKSFFLFYLDRKEFKNKIKKFSKAVLENKISSIEFPIEDCKDYYNVKLTSNIIVNGNNKTIQCVINYRYNFEKKIVENKVLKDIYSFFRELFVYIYVNKIDHNEEKEERKKYLILDFIINSEDINFDADDIYENIINVVDKIKED